MTKNSIAKIASISAGAVMALGFVSTVGAATTSELQAQINALMSQLSSMQGSAMVSTTFTANLTVGSKGSQVVALQDWLETKGYLVMPAGVAKGYFGGLTRSAVAKFQKANSISPAVGYFGPTTRGIVNAMLINGSTTGGTTTGGTTTGGTTTGGTTTGGSTGVITTPGVEGTMTVELSSNPSSGTTLREGDVKAPVLGLDITAKSSDIKVQRVKLDLGTNSTIYTKKYSRVYLTDPSGNVLASSDLNSSTVVKDGANYYITLSGFGYVVPKDAKRTLTVTADLYSAVNSTYQVATVIAVPANGVRGIDGAGIDQYGPSTGFSRSMTIGGSLVDSATFQLSTSASTAKSSDVIANGGTNNNEADAVVLGSFDVRAEKDSVLFRDLSVTVSKTGTGTATATTAYLFDGTTQIASASINASTGVAAFTNFNLPVAKDATKTLTVKADIRNANATPVNLTLTVAAGSLNAENSQGSTVVATGSVTGNTMVVRSVGPVFTLLSKSVTRNAASSFAGSTSTASATFNVQVKAVGGDITFGTQASSNPMFVFGVYKGSTLTVMNVASTSNIVLPSTGTVAAGTNSFTVQRNNTVTLPVNFLFEARTVAGSLIGTDNYAIGIQQINWSADAGATTQTSTYMAGQNDWRTDYVALP